MHIPNKTIPAVAAALAFALLTVLSGCGAGVSVVTIWTDCADVVAYTEQFNAAHDSVKAIVVYKERPGMALPPAKGEKRPDIVIGSFLKNAGVRKHFARLDFLLGERRIPRGLFYGPLLDYGKSGRGQYLLPVSFNVPAMIFSGKNAALVPGERTLELGQIRDTAAKFNARNAKGVFTNMGFAPGWNSGFLYAAAVLGGASFAEGGGGFSWDGDALDDTVSYLREWTAEKNSSTAEEQDFEFKYLYMPGHKQILSGRCLFAYTASNEFFGLPQDQIEDADFRWVARDGMMVAEDGMTMLGLYKRARFSRGAAEFITWLLNEQTQRDLLAHKAERKLSTQTFGICDGFSALAAVNERVFPVFYTTLLGNVPEQGAVLAPPELPPDWETLKQRVVLPYLTDATNTSAKSHQSIEDRLRAWAKQQN